MSGYVDQEPYGEKTVEEWAVEGQGCEEETTEAETIQEQSGKEDTAQEDAVEPECGEEEATEGGAIQEQGDEEDATQEDAVEPECGEEETTEGGAIQGQGGEEDTAHEDAVEPECGEEEPTVAEAIQGQEDEDDTAHEDAVEPECGEEETTEAEAVEGHGCEEEASEETDSFDFRRWEPFRNTGLKINRNIKEPPIQQLYQSLYNAETTDEKANIVIHAMKPILDWGNREWTARNWMEREIRKTFEDMDSFPHGSNLLQRRYIQNPDYDTDKTKTCSHVGDCLCWFEATANAGIPDFPINSRNRLALIEYAHHFYSELLMQLVEWTNYLDDLFWDSDENQSHGMASGQQLEALEEALRLAGSVSEFNTLQPDSNPNDDELLMADRADYLWAHGHLMRMASGEQIFYYPDVINNPLEQEKEEGTTADTFGIYRGRAESYIALLDDKTRESLGYMYAKVTGFDDRLERHWKLLGTIGCRLMGLTICKWGKASLFYKREPVKVWKFGKIVQELDESFTFDEQDRYLSQGRGIKTDEPRYPTRVINTETYQFEKDAVAFKSKYAILSHTWGADEVDYDSAPKIFGQAKEQRLLNKIAETEQKLKNNAPVTQVDHLESLRRELKFVKKENEERGQKEAGRAAKEGKQPQQKRSSQSSGEKKLLMAIEKARNCGFTYLWSDTVCIDKKNHKEHSENIASMGDFYKNAHICLIYLDDIDNPADATTRKGEETGQQKGTTHLSEVVYTKWSSRGWTLQECIMSSHVLVFNHHWKLIFDSEKEKRDSFRALYEHIGKVFHVPPQLLWIGEQPKVAAQFILALSYARETTCPEDRAYSLMGLLGVRMVIHYGEGAEKAYLRLLENVVESSNDVSIFNWSGLNAGNKNPGRSLFPRDFSSYITKNERQSLAFDEELPKPMRAPFEITVGASGVHGRYEIWMPGIIFEGNNTNAYEAIQRYERILENASPENFARAQLDFEVNCTFDVPNRDYEHDIHITAHCTCDSLRAQLQHELNQPNRPPSRWVLAKFAGVADAEWFLCQLNFGERELMEKGWFRDIFDRPEESLVRKGNNSLAYAYLESRGFQAIRIPTGNFDNYMKLVPNEQTWVANLWVG